MQISTKGRPGGVHSFLYGYFIETGLAKFGKVVNRHFYEDSFGLAAAGASFTAFPLKMSLLCFRYVYEHIPT